VKENNVVLLEKKGEFERLIECKFEGREHCKETFFEKCKTINSGIYGRSVCTLKRCCKYSLKGDVTKKISCKDGHEHCTTDKYKIFNIIKVNKYCTKKQICFISRIKNKITKEKCEFEPEICVEYLRTSCAKKKQDHIVFKKDVVLMELKEIKKRKVECHWEGREKCETIYVKECHIEKSNPHCTQKKCCKVAVTGDVRKIESCEFEGEEHCTEIFSTKCSLVHESKYCEQKICCVYGKKGKSVKKYKCYKKGGLICRPHRIKKCKKLNSRPFVAHTKCFKNYCCEYIIIGTHVTQGKCRFEGREHCEEVKWQECKPKAKSHHCSQIQCCTHSKKGSETKVLDCHFKGITFCVEKIFHRCYHTNTGLNCHRKKCCKYGKNKELLE